MGVSWNLDIKKQLGTMIGIGINSWNYSTEDICEILKGMVSK